MALATLSIDLVAKLAQFQQDLGQAVRISEQNAARMATAFRAVGTAVTAAFAGLSVGAVTAIVRAQIDLVDGFNDVKDATGSSIENISALDEIARRNGTTWETVSNSLVKFNAALGEAGDPESGAGRVFKALGLDVERLKQLDPAEALQQTAVALSGFADDGNKARAVQELFGKSLREVAPWLNDLAQAGQLNATVTSQQAEEAERFNKQLAAMAAEAEALKRELSLGLLPALNGILKNFRDIREIGGLDLVLKDAAKNLLSFGLAGNTFNGDPGQKINEVIEERTRAERDLARAQKEGHRPHMAAIQEEIDGYNRTLGVLRVLQRNRILAGDQGDVGDAVSRSMPRIGSIGVAAKKTGGGGVSLADQGLKLAESLTAQDAGLSPDFYEKWNKLSAAYKGNKISLDKLIESQEILLKQQPKLKGEVYTGDTSDAQSRRMADIAATQKMSEELNAEINRLADGGDTRKRQLTEALEKRLRSGETFTPEKLDQIVRGIAGIGVEMEKNKDIAGDFASSFTSRFEDAILKGENLREVIKGLGMDILQIGIRTAITQPLGKAAGDWAAGIFSGLFGGFRAEGGDVSAGTAYVVGERGPELLVPKSAGRVVPNHALKGGGGRPVVVNQYFTVGDVASMAAVRKEVARGKNEIAAALARSKNYGGAFAA